MPLLYSDNLYTWDSGLLDSAPLLLGRQPRVLDLALGFLLGGGQPTSTREIPGSDLNWFNLQFEEFTTGRNLVRTF